MRVVEIEEKSAEPELPDLDPEKTQEIIPPSLDDIRAFLGIDEPWWRRS